MDIRDFLPHKRTCSQIISYSEPDSDTNQATSLATLSITHTSDEEHEEPHQKRQYLTPSEIKKIYKAKLSYKKEWEKN